MVLWSTIWRPAQRMEGLGRAEFPTRPRSHEWAKQNCVLNRPMLKTCSFNLPNRRHPALENSSGSSGSSGLSHSWEFFPPHRTLSLPAFCFRTTRYIRPRRESRKNFFSHVLQFNDQQYAPTYKYTPSLLFVPRHLISHSPPPLPHTHLVLASIHKPLTIMNCLEDRLDSPFSSPLAMFEDEHNGSEGWWSTTNPRLGVQGASFIFSQPVPFNSCLSMGIQ